MVKILDIILGKKLDGTNPGTFSELLIYLDGRLVDLETTRATIANMYKAAVNTGDVNDDSITGKMYYLLNQFKIGFNYANTGVLGTDMYLKNFRLYDVTDESGEISIVDNKGVSHVDTFSEMGITDGLIAYYPLKKDFKDYSGNGYHGTAYGTPTLTDGINQKCYSFDTTNGIDISNLTINANMITVSGWFKREGVPKSNCHILTFDTSMEISIPDNTGEIRTSIIVDNVRSVSNHGSGLTDNGWHFLCMTYDGEYRKSYIDGKLVGSVNMVGTMKEPLTNTIGRDVSNTHGTNG